jgi:hypothetical protein
LFPKLVFICSSQSTRLVSSEVDKPSTYAAVYVFRPYTLGTLLNRCQADHITRYIDIYGAGYTPRDEEPSVEGFAKDIDTVFLLDKGVILPSINGKVPDFDQDVRSLTKSGRKRFYTLSVPSDQPDPNLQAITELFLDSSKAGNTARSGYKTAGIACQMSLSSTAVGILAECVGFV